MKIIKTASELVDTKIYLSNKDDVIKFQKHVFELGVSWIDVKKNISNTDQRCFCIDQTLSLYYMGKEDFIKNDAYSQIFLDDVLSIGRNELSIFQIDDGKRSEIWVHYTPEEAIRCHINRAGTEMYTDTMRPKDIVACEISRTDLASSVPRNISKRILNRRTPGLVVVGEPHVMFDWKIVEG